MFRKKDKKLDLFTTVLNLRVISAIKTKQVKPIFNTFRGFII